METEKISAVPVEKVYLWEFGGEKIIVPENEIIYIHTEQRKVYVHTVQGVYRIRGSLKAAVKEVEGLPMVKIHASYLVRLEYIQRVSRYSAVLKNGECLPVSARCWRCLKPVLEAYIKERAWKNPLT